MAKQELLAEYYESPALLRYRFQGTGFKYQYRERERRSLRISRHQKNNKE